MLQTITLTLSRTYDIAWHCTMATICNRCAEYIARNDKRPAEVNH